MMWRNNPARRSWLTAVLSFLLLLAPALTMQAQEPTWQRLISSDKEPQNWLSYGGNYRAHRYSGLRQINRSNVKSLVPVWQFHTGELRGGLNATPIVADGVLYLMGPLPEKLEIKEGQPLFGGSMEFKPPKDKPAYGHINAFDPLTGERKWRYNTRYMNLASLLSTAGDLLFSGDVLGEVFALDAKTGQKLWGHNVGAGMSGSPITYAANGRQYLAMPTGMGSLNGGLIPQIWPESANKIPERASTLVVFALPETKGAAGNGK